MVLAPSLIEAVCRISIHKENHLSIQEAGAPSLVKSTLTAPAEAPRNARAKADFMFTALLYQMTLTIGFTTQSTSFNLASDNKTKDDFNPQTRHSKKKITANRKRRIAGTEITKDKLLYESRPTRIRKTRVSRVFHAIGNTKWTNQLILYSQRYINAASPGSAVSKRHECTLSASPKSICPQNPFVHY